MNVMPKIYKQSKIQIEAVKRLIVKSGRMRS